MSSRPFRFGLETWLGQTDVQRAGRIAYVGNRACRTAVGDSSGVAALLRAGARVAAIWAPEHGFEVADAAGAPVGDGAGPLSLPVFGLYGKRRAPDRRMLDGCDTILYDLQDVGARYYTYWYVLKQCLQAGAGAGKTVVVCDRPNPLGAARRGNVLRKDADALVGCWPMAMQHGVTAGDVAARWAPRHPRANVTVARMEGWQRDRSWEHMGLPWTPPSPNLPDLNAVRAYPGTCLGEGTTLSVGRGTPWPFQWFGAPWLNAVRIADAVNEGGAGWRAVVEPCTPELAPHVGVKCRGIRFERTGDAADPLPPALAAIRAALHAHPDDCHFHDSHFDALAGGPELRNGLLAGDPVPTLMGSWSVERARATLTPTDMYA